MPDISKWKAKNLEEMHSLLSDCLSLLFIPDISKWNNYNENDLNEIRNYNRINNILNFNFDYYKEMPNPESYDFSNDVEFKKQIEAKINKFL